jgi:hypothetical protein
MIKEKYQDQISSGQTSIMAKYRRGSIAITVGNLKPGDSLEVALELVMFSTAENGKWQFYIPGSLTPKYYFNGTAPDPSEVILRALLRHRRTVSTPFRSVCGLVARMEYLTYPLQRPI